MAPLFRQAGLDDLESIIALDRSVRTAPDQPEHAADWLEPSAEVALRAWVEAGECHVAEEGGSIAAFAVLHNHFFHDPIIDLLIVGAPWRRKGIGSGMVRYLATVCRPPKLWTSTNLSNQPMQALLAREGFKMSGFIEGLDEGDPELIYMKLVPSEAPNR
ncbi:N-acetyltransferase family protein [Paradevosia shaoguanensis]|uniref:GNAT family N-acetyltransferase n=1 Tax=Paradevosia shaoguanensis TaxID=1335043 RepID=UPI003C757B4D